MVVWIIFECLCYKLSTDKYVNVYGLGGQTYTYHHEEDESSFQLVDTAKMQKPLYQKGRPRFNQVCSGPVQ